MARVSLDQLLERCLQELARTGDVEGSLRRYPGYADRLRPLLQVAQKARLHYAAVPEAPGRLAAGRERLLAVAAQQRAGSVSTALATGTTTMGAGRRKTKLVLAVKLVAVLLAVVVGTIALGGGVIWAAGESLPGDLLYPVKLAVEDARLVFAFAPADQVDLALQLVEKRAEEVQALVVSGQPVPDETVARMERHVERALSQAAWAADEEMIGLLMSVSERTRMQAQVLEQVRVTATQQAQAGLERAVTVCQRGAQAAEEGLSDPQAFRWRYRHRQGTPEPTNEPGRLAVTPEGDQDQDRDQEQERDQQQDQERECTPVCTPHVTPHGPQATPGPQVTPYGPQATPVPQVTPQEPQRTPVPPAATPHPQDTGGGQGGDRKDDGEHGGGGPGGGGK